LAELSHIPDFERGRFWRRALALLIDLAVAAVMIQLAVLVLFPLTGGRLQFLGGMQPTCDTLTAMPEGVSLPSDYAVGWIYDCRYELFGMATARILTITRIPQQEATASATSNINRLLDAEGKPFNAPTLDSLALLLPFVFRFWFDRGRGTPGRRICRVRLTGVIEARSPLPIGAAARRYAAQALPLVPLVIWSLLQRVLTAEQAALSVSGSAFLMVPGAGLLIAVPIAVHAMIYRKDAWYDRWAMTCVLRLDQTRALIPLPADAPSAVPVEAIPTHPPPLPSSRTGNYFVRHWRGELSLPMSYWANGVVLSAATGMVSGALLAAFTIYGEEQLVPWMIALQACCLAISLLAIWQVVGVWRAATRYKRSGRSFWGGAAKVAVALAALQFVYVWVFAVGPQILETYEMATGDAAFGPHEFNLLADGQMLDFYGGIKFGIAREFESLLHENKGVTTVRLSSIGGRIREAQKMSDIVKARGLATYVVEECLSACTVVFLGGKERFLLEGALLGFHQPSFRGMTAHDKTIAIAEEEARLRTFGLSKSFVERANSASPDDMWYPEQDELVREKVVTWIVPAQPSNPSESTLSVEDTVPVRPRPPSVFPTPGAALGGSGTGPVMIPTDLIRRLTPPVTAPEPKAETATAGESK
jgi:hypothetical protein